MNKIKQILDKSSKKRIDFLLNEINKTPNLVEEVLSLALINEHPYSWRASWALSHYSKKNKKFIEENQDRIILKLEEIKHPSQIGCLLITLNNVELNSENLGIVADVCIAMLKGEIEAGYIRMYAMEVMVKIARQYPELSSEFIEVIDYAKQGFEKNYIISRAEKAINELTKLKA
jgi:hypothetical protein